jgi:hypothetical protein
VVIIYNVLLLLQFLAMARTRTITIKGSVYDEDEIIRLIEHHNDLFDHYENKIKELQEILDIAKSDDDVGLPPYVNPTLADRTFASSRCACAIITALSDDETNLTDALYAMTDRGRVVLPGRITEIIYKACSSSSTPEKRALCVKMLSDKRYTGAGIAFIHNYTLYGTEPSIMLSCRKWRDVLARKK